MRYFTFLHMDDKAYKTLRNAISILGEMDSQLLDIATKTKDKSMELFEAHCLDAFNQLFDFVEYYDKYYKDEEEN